jgi:hypothetical protein
VHDDSGQIGLVKLLVGLAVVGLVLFELGAVAVNHVQLDGLAERAARSAAASHATRPTRELTTARQGAEAAIADEPHAHLVDVTLQQDGRVAVTLSRPARVLVIDRIGFLEDFATAAITRSAAPPG